MASVSSSHGSVTESSDDEQEPPSAEHLAWTEFGADFVERGRLGNTFFQYWPQGVPFTYASECSGMDTPWMALTMLLRASQRFIYARYLYNCEIDSVARRFLRANLPRPERTCANILNSDVRTLARRIALFCCGFPCQPYSALHYNTQLLEDPNCRQMWATFDHILTMLPAICILENVVGFLKVIDQVLEYVSQKLPMYEICWDFIDPLHHGSPITRQRIYIILIKTDLQWILALFCASFLDSSEVGDSLDELPDLKPSAEASPVSADAVPEGMAVGSEVWACWPGDGRWFRAKVTGASQSSVSVAWLRRGSEKRGEEDEYLSSTGCDELLFTRLPHASVLAAKDRPAQAVVEKADRWKQQLGRVEELSHRFRSVRNICNKLAMQSGPPRDPLQGLADQLAALRKESEARMSDLLGAAEARASAGGGINEQLTSSTEGFQVEIDSMHQEQQALQSRLQQLKADRQELVKKLQALDEEIAVATSAYQASAQRERQVRASAKRVAGELKRELSIEEVEARKVGDRQRLLMEATAASKDIEGLLESRAESAKARIAAWEQLSERQAKAQGICLQSEKDRARACEELLAGWHAAVWGPEAQELCQDTEALATLRALHGRSSGSLQQAWKDTVQLAAECLGEGSALGDASEELSRSAERYKAMLKEIKSNLDRMKVLEAAAAKMPSPQDPAAAAQAVPGTPVEVQGNGHDGAQSGTKGELENSTATSTPQASQADEDEAE